MIDFVIGRIELFYKEMLSFFYFLIVNFFDWDVSFCYIDNRIDFINK